MAHPSVESYPGLNLAGRAVAAADDRSAAEALESGASPTPREQWHDPSPVCAACWAY